MVVNRRKKITKLRGSRNYGWGLRHRNSGQSGGAGRAGTGKRCHSKKPSVWGTAFFGKDGFVSKQRIEDTTIGLRDLEDKLPTWVKEQKAKVENGTVVIDLSKLGYTKLLGSGKTTRKVKITVKQATEEAKEKVKQAGGEIATAST